MNLTKTITEEYESVSAAQKSELNISRNNKTQENFIDVWNKTVQKIFKNNEYYDALSIYRTAESRISGTNKNAEMYKREDISAFCFELADLQKKYPLCKVANPSFTSLAGMFLSALINYHVRSSQEKKEKLNEEYPLPVAHLEPLHYIGFENIAHLKVIGNVGYNLGHRLRWGRIDVLGNALDNIGFYAGRTHPSLQAEIHIQGSYGSINGECKAKIFCNDNQIFPEEET